ncbi:hypothetical protein ABZ464_02545 [Streptomyces sp. NPDC005820]|uniref:hypothetical protein n=1 Tax=Streptomyces sp. NPDC005820 TaxID=3157069 RepID=UPI0033DCDFE7
MKLTELIAHAEKALKEYGDIRVVVPDSGCGCCKGYEYEEAVPEVETAEITVWENSKTIKVATAYVVT